MLSSGPGGAARPGGARSAAPEQAPRLAPLLVSAGADAWPASGVAAGAGTPTGRAAGDAGSGACARRRPGGCVTGHRGTGGMQAKATTHRQVRACPAWGTSAASWRRRSSRAAHCCASASRARRSSSPFACAAPRQSRGASSPGGRRRRGAPAARPRAPAWPAEPPSPPLPPPRPPAWRTAAPPACERAASARGAAVRSCSDSRGPERGRGARGSQALRDGRRGLRLLAQRGLGPALVLAQPLRSGRLARQLACAARG